MKKAKTVSDSIEHIVEPTTVYTAVLWGDYIYGRSVAVITERCQRLNPGSNPGVRTILLQITLITTFSGNLSPKTTEYLTTEEMSLGPRESNE